MAAIAEIPQPARDRLEPWARLWERSASIEFLRGYGQAAGAADFLPATPADFSRLLDA